MAHPVDVAHPVDMVHPVDKVPPNGGRISCTVMLAIDSIP